MRVVITKNSLPVSKLIRWVFNEPGSHFIVIFDDLLAFHSNLMGFQVAWWPDLKAHNVVVDELVPVNELSLGQEEALYQEILQLRDSKDKITSNIGSAWDYSAAVYLFWKGLLHKMFGSPLPNTNPMNQKSWFLCSEVAKIFGLVDEKVDTSSKTPWMIRTLMLSSGKFRSANG